jgi:ankyrin repeat protein
LTDFSPKFLRFFCFLLEKKRRENSQKNHQTHHFYCHSGNCQIVLCLVPTMSAITITVMRLRDWKELNELYDASERLVASDDWTINHFCHSVADVSAFEDALLQCNTEHFIGKATLSLSLNTHPEEETVPKMMKRTLWRVLRNVLTRKARNWLADDLSWSLDGYSMVARIATSILSNWCIDKNWIDSMDPDGDTVFTRAAMYGHASVVELLLAHPYVDKSSIDLGNKYGGTGLICAAMKGHTSIVEQLLAHPRVDKNSIDHTDVTGSTVLMYAAKEGHTSVVEALLADRRVDKNSIDHTDDVNGCTALMFAALEGHTSIVELLLADPRVDKASIVCSNFFGYTALMCAARSGYASIVELLLADPRVDKNYIDHIDEDGYTALMHAAGEGHTSTVELLLADPRVDQASINTIIRGGTALRYAAKSGHCPVVKLLISDSRTSWDSIVELTSHRRINDMQHDEILSLILAELTHRQMCAIYPCTNPSLWPVPVRADADSDADATSGGPGDGDAKEDGISEPECALITSFFNSGVFDVNVLRIIREYATPLSFSGINTSISGWKELSELRAASRRLFDSDGRTIEKFCHSVADVSAFEDALLQCNTEHFRAKADAASLNRHPNEDPREETVPKMMKRTLWSVMRNVLTRNWLADDLSWSVDGYSMVARIATSILSSWCIDKNWIDFSDPEGYTVFMRAAMYGHASVVELLLAHPYVDKSSIDLGNQYGWTVLICAAMKGHTSIVEQLLADPRVDKNSIDHTDVDGSAALMFAAMEGHTSIVELLLADRRVDKNSIDRASVRYGSTALMQAAEEGHTAIMELFLADPRVDKDSIDHTDIYGRTALMCAARSGHTSTVELLLEDPRVDQASINRTGKDYMTALMHAAREGHTSTVELLLADPRVDQASIPNMIGGGTALYYAAVSGHFPVVKLLLSDSRTSWDSIVELTDHRRIDGMRHNEILSLILAELMHRQMCVIYPSTNPSLWPVPVRADADADADSDAASDSGGPGDGDAKEDGISEPECALITSFFESGVFDVNVLRSENMPHIHAIPPCSCLTLTLITDILMLTTSRASDIIICKRVFRVESVAGKLNIIFLLSTCVVLYATPSKPVCVSLTVIIVATVPCVTPHCFL